MNAARQKLFEGYKNMSDHLSEHDPLNRAMPGEPHFLLLARDPTAADLVRIWVAIRRRDPSLIDAVVKRLKGYIAEMPYRPKDAAHVLSGQQVSNAMDLWLMEQQAPVNVDDAP